MADMREWFPSVLATKVGGKWWFLAEDWRFQPDPFKSLVFLRHADGLTALRDLDSSNLPEGYDTGYVKKFQLGVVPYVNDWELEDG